jgi:hypothetical protein
LSIDVVYESGGYRVFVDPPHADEWRSPGLLTATEVLEELSKRGCHSTDITDALYAANPTWTQEHDKEVRRRRDAELKSILDTGEEQRP